MPGRSRGAPAPVRVLLFATARTAVGSARLDWTVPDEGLSARALVDQLVARFPTLGAVVGSSRLFHNGEPVRHPSDRVHPGDEFAVHPPYGGG